MTGQRVIKNKPCPSPILGGLTAADPRVADGDRHEGVVLEGGGAEDDGALARDRVRQEVVAAEGVGVGREVDGVGLDQDVRGVVGGVFRECDELASQRTGTTG